ncbi:MAG: hypothetical protein DRP62_05045, partial [Planctomycetota bacterium]
ELDKSGIRLPQKCPTTNNNTNRETNKKTIAPPAPLPAWGQAKAALTERPECENSLSAAFAIPADISSAFGKSFYTPA